MSYLSFAVILFIINLPFGYWRSNTQKFSAHWLFSIHIPVLLIIGIRIFSGLGFSLTSFLISVSFFFLGQFSGGKLRVLLTKKIKYKSTSCLIMDTFRILFHVGN